MTITTNPPKLLPYPSYPKMDRVYYERTNKFSRNNWSVRFPSDWYPYLRHRSKVFGGDRVVSLPPFLSSRPPSPTRPSIHTYIHTFVRLPEIPSANSESRPLTGRRPDGLGPTIYRLDSLVSSVAREREVDALCAAVEKGWERRREREGERRRERERERRGWKAPLSVAASCLCAKRCHLRGIMGRSFGRRDRTGDRSYGPLASISFSVSP